KNLVQSRARARETVSDSRTVPPCPENIVLSLFLLPAYGGEGGHRADEGRKVLTPTATGTAGTARAAPSSESCRSRCAGSRRRRPRRPAATTWRPCPPKSS